MPKKARRLATRSALLSKFQSGDVRVVDQITVGDKPRTKAIAGMYKKLGIDRSCVFALNGRNELLEKSARNIDRTTLTTVQQLNVWDLLRNRTLLLTKDGLEAILK
jgi:large subunit ribosomal protein L4